MKEQVRLASKEHRSFTSMFLLSTFSIAFYLFCILKWVWSRLRLTQRDEQTDTHSRGDLSSAEETNKRTNEADSEIKHNREAKLIKKSKGLTSVNKTDLFNLLASRHCQSFSETNHRRKRRISQ